MGNFSSNPFTTKYRQDTQETGLLSKTLLFHPTASLLFHSFSFNGFTLNIIIWCSWRPWDPSRSRYHHSSSYTKLYCCTYYGTKIRNKLPNWKAFFPTHKCLSSAWINHPQCARAYKLYFNYFPVFVFFTFGYSENIPNFKTILIFQDLLSLLTAVKQHKCSFSRDIHPNMPGIRMFCAWAQMDQLVNLEGSYSDKVMLVSYGSIQKQQAVETQSKSRFIWRPCSYKTGIDLKHDLFD